MDHPTAPWRSLDETAGTGVSVPTTGHPLRRRAAVAGAIVAAAALSLSALLLVASGPRPVATVGAGVDQVAGVGGPASTGDPSAPPTASATAGPGLVVHVAGAVQRPGLVRLVAGARVADAIEAAGGLGPRVDATRVDRELNLAAPVADGDHIVVPSRDDAAMGGTAPAVTSTPTGRVDLNHATSEALDALPGIGPTTAAKIIAARQQRPFRTLDELVTRKVLGQATLAKIRDLVELR